MFFRKPQRFRLFTLTLVLTAVLAAGCNTDRSVGPSAAPEPEQLKKVERLNTTADELYKKALEGDILTARNKLNEIGDQLTQIRFEGITSVEGVGALTQSVVEAKRAFNAVSFSPNEGQTAAAKIRLATDALTHKTHPMWLQYYKVMKEDVNQLEKAIKINKKDDALAAMGKLSNHFAIIRPSLLISREPSEVEKLQSLFAIFNNQLNASKWDTKELHNGLQNLHAAIDELFQRKERAAYVAVADRPNPALWIAGIGSIIIAVLAFAAWRIFQVENSFIGRRRKNEDR